MRLTRSAIFSGSLPWRIGPVAQWLEPTAHNGLVGGSSPPGPTTHSPGLLVSYITRNSSLVFKDLADIFPDVSVSVRGNSGFWAACLCPLKFRFPAAKAETPRDRFTFGWRRVRQRRLVGVLLARGQDRVEIGTEKRRARVDHSQSHRACSSATPSQRFGTFLTMPISWRGTLAQYAGRLHRLHAAKREVVIYDYVEP